MSDRGDGIGWLRGLVETSPGRRYAVPGDASLHVSPWWSVTDGERRDGGEWTVSDVPDRPGWETDGGHSRYGLTAGEARKLAALASSADAILDALDVLSRVREEWDPRDMEQDGKAALDAFDTAILEHLGTGVCDGEGDPSERAPDAE